MFHLFFILLTIIHTTISERIYPDDAFKITFDRENRTYGVGEFIGVTVTHIRKTGDPELENVIINTISRLKTVRRKCKDSKKCEIEDSVVVKLSTIRHVYHPLPDPVKIGLNTIEMRPKMFVRKDYTSSFEGINGYERHGMHIQVVTKDNRTQNFPMEYYNAILGIDLSLSSSYEKPLVCEQNATVRGKTVSVKVGIPKNGWVYPETIPVKVTIENKSQWIVKQIIGEVVMSQKTYTPFGKKDFGIESHKFNESEAIVSNSTVASITWFNSRKKSFAHLKTIKIPIRHRKTSFLHTIELTDHPVLENKHFVRISVQLTDPLETSEVHIPVFLDCEFPVTFGIVPTKNTNVKTPTKWAPADKRYQSKMEILDHTVLYPSFEQLRNL